MANDVRVYDVSCAASISPASPLEIALLPASQYTVSRVTIIIPDGHAGLTGIALAFGHQAVIPSNTGAFISGNDENVRLPMSGYPAGVPWSVFVCNSDLQEHMWEVRFELDLIVLDSRAAPVQLLAPSDIYSAGAAPVGVL